MKKILLFLSLSVFAISCNNDFDVTADPSAPTVPVAFTATQSEESVCTYNFDIAASEGVATIYYVVLPTADAAPTSSEIFNGEYADESASLDVETVDLLAGETSSFSAADLASGTAYTVYAVSVNVDGIRSEQVFTSSVSVPEYASLASATADFAAATSFTGAPSLGSDSDFSPFTPTVASVSSTQYTFNTFWGTEFIAEVFGNPTYVNQFNYGGTLTINPDLTVTIVGNAPAAWDNAGGTGTYNPCDKTLTYRLNHTLFTSGGQPAPVDVVVTLNN